MMALSFKGAHFPPEVILMGVRWYAAYPLSTCHVEELMEERRVEVDHFTINRWVIKYSPLLEEEFHRRKRPVWVSWRMDETYIRTVEGASRADQPRPTRPLRLLWDSGQCGQPPGRLPPCRALLACNAQEPQSEGEGALGGVLGYQLAGLLLQWKQEAATNR
jgi:hypothetical protein